jgi:glycosyltransferase involved in cell wall biosynthesis
MDLSLGFEATKTVAKLHQLKNSPWGVFGLGRNDKSEANPKEMRPRLVAVVNSSIAVGFVRGQLEFFQGRGFDVTLLCPPRRKDEWEVPRPAGISIIEIPMERKIAPWRDFFSLWRLWRAMRALRPTVTNVGTPKAGLLGGLAAWLNRVPCRIYTLHGLRFETTKGLKRLLLVNAERLACLFAHRVVCVSRSVREKAITCGLTSREQTVVFGSGSCNGIDAARFASTPEIIRRAIALRIHLRIPLRARVILYVGRLTCDKGIPELAEAFLPLAVKFPDLRLLLVGCFEPEDTLPSNVRTLLENHHQVIFAGAARDIAPYYALADLLVLPSHREGLPIVVLEAQAAGIPVVGASVTGIIDVVKDRETGLLFPAGNVPKLIEALEEIVRDNALAARLALAGQEQVKREFQQEQVWEALLQGYLEVLQSKEPQRPFRPFSLTTSPNSWIGDSLRVGAAKRKRMTSHEESARKIAIDVEGPH